jgi:hypothetical protein
MRPPRPPPTRSAGRARSKRLRTFYPGDAVDRMIPTDELFEKLQPFKELVVEDIERED